MGRNSPSAPTGVSCASGLGSGAEPQRGLGQSPSRGPGREAPAGFGQSILHVRRLRADFYSN